MEGASNVSSVFGWGAREDAYPFWSAPEAGSTLRSKTTATLNSRASDGTWAETLQCLALAFGSLVHLKADLAVSLGLVTFAVVGYKAILNNSLENNRSHATTLFLYCTSHVYQVRPCLDRHRLAVSS